MHSKKLEVLKVFFDGGCVPLGWSFRRCSVLSLGEVQGNLFSCLFLVNLFTFLFIETLVKKQSMPTSVYKSIILLSDLEFPLVTSVVLLTGKPPY